MPELLSLLAVLKITQITRKSEKHEKRLTAVLCAICGKPVSLNECKTNDHGKPVHEACFAESLSEEVKKRKAALDQSPLRK